MFICLAALAAMGLLCACLTERVCLCPALYLCCGLLVWVQVSCCC
jgi:hypothetical protein